jgi:hypothetical protein
MPLLGVSKMDYVTKEDVVKIIKRLFEDRHFIDSPTTWRCMLTVAPPGQRKLLGLYPLAATPRNAELIIEFHAQDRHSQPQLDWIRQAVENSWQHTGLAQVRRVDHEREPKHIDETDN